MRKGLKTHRRYFLITIKLAPFYIALCRLRLLSTIISVGTGHTVYNAIISLIINLGYYGHFLYSSSYERNYFYNGRYDSDVRFGMVVH